MPYCFFVWTPEIVEHVAEHGVAPEKFEEVVSEPQWEERSRSTGNRLVFGSTSEGRFLCCVFKRFDQDMIEPVTAYEVGE